MAKQIHITLSEEAYKELDQLKQQLKLDTITDVIKCSVSLTKFLELEKTNGNDLILRNQKTEKEKTLIMLKV